MGKECFLSRWRKESVTLNFDPQTTRFLDLRDTCDPSPVKGHVEGHVVVRATGHVSVSDFRVYFLCLCGNRPTDPLRLKPLDGLPRGACQKTFRIRQSPITSQQVVFVYRSHTGHSGMAPDTPLCLRGSRQRTVDLVEAFRFDVEHALPETVPAPGLGGSSPVHLRYALVAWCRYRRVDGLGSLCPWGARRQSVAKAVHEVVVRRPCSLRMLFRRMALLPAQRASDVSAVLFCAVPCCGVPCCAVPCCAVLCCISLLGLGKGVDCAYMMSQGWEGRSQQIRWVGVLRGCAGGLLGAGGLIQCRLALPYRGLVRGEQVPALLCIYNCSRYTVTSSCLQLVQLMMSRPVAQEFTFTATGAARARNGGAVVREVVVGEVQLERVAPHSQWQRAVPALRVPDACCTDGSLPDWPFLSVRFFVRLKLTYGFWSAMTCDVGCYVGTKRCDAPLSKPTVNLDRLRIYPADFLKYTDMTNLPFILLAPTHRVQSEPLAASEDIPLLS
ncbi:uncharacterized protein LOC143297089 [Babylonia areolata]|uniref:uncharacterized protein LOC143297089 n=1 Tax=Babylonia areolata TaxID=304850 RepID=UPI003FCF51A7